VNVALSDFLPEVPNVNGDSVGAGVVVESPDLLQQLGVREHPARFGGQHGE
jgi:hypothetical protein